MFKNYLRTAINNLLGGFLDMFELDVVTGNLTDSLMDPGKVALRADVVQRFFGSDMAAADILGQVLSISAYGVSRDYQVAAIYRFPAGNTVLDLPMLTQLDDSVLPPVYSNWGAVTVYGYVQLLPGVPVDNVRRELQEFTDQNANIQ